MADSTTFRALYVIAWIIAAPYLAFGILYSIATIPLVDNLLVDNLLVDILTAPLWLIIGASLGISGRIGALQCTSPLKAEWLRCFLLIGIITATSVGCVIVVAIFWQELYSPISELHPILRVGATMSLSIIAFDGWVSFRRLADVGYVRRNRFALVGIWIATLVLMAAAGRLLIMF